MIELVPGDNLRVTPEQFATIFADCPEVTKDANYELPLFICVPRIFWSDETGHIAYWAACTEKNTDWHVVRLPWLTICKTFKFVEEYTKVKC